MKKRRLKCWVKIVLIILISIIIYSLTGELGKLAQHSRIYSFLCVSAWVWLFLGQFIVIYFIVENKINKYK